MLEAFVTEFGEKKYALRFEINGRRVPADEYAPLAVQCIATLEADLDQCRALKLRTDSAHRDDIARLRVYAKALEDDARDQQHREWSRLVTADDRIDDLRERCGIDPEMMEDGQ